MWEAQAKVEQAPATARRAGLCLIQIRGYGDDEDIGFARK